MIESKWTDAYDGVLKQLYAHDNWDTILAALPFTKRAIFQRANRLRLKRGYTKSSLDLGKYSWISREKTLAAGLLDPLQIALKSKNKVVVVCCRCGRDRQVFIENARMARYCGSCAKIKETKQHLHVCDAVCAAARQKCRICRTETSTLNFAVDPTKPRGHVTICKSCKNEYMRDRSQHAHDCSTAECSTRVKFCSFCLIEHPLSFFSFQATAISGHNGKCLFKDYTDSATSRGLDFQLQLADIIALTSDARCHYCGDVSKRFFTGIDRIDSAIGYRLDNCLPCCTRCNMMKMTTSYADFIQRCKNIARLHGEG